MHVSHAKRDVRQVSDNDKRADQGPIRLSDWTYRLVALQEGWPAFCSSLSSTTTPLEGGEIVHAETESAFFKVKMCHFAVVNVQVVTMQIAVANTGIERFLRHCLNGRSCILRCLLDKAEVRRAMSQTGPDDLKGLI